MNISVESTLVNLYISSMSFRFYFFEERRDFIHS